jgi:single-strand selective monofunctional uracil DNA glycosylase
MLATHRNGEEEAIPLYLQVSGSEQNVEDAGGRKVEVLLVGMNPGPFGMAQTGVPFGDSVFVRNFLHVTGKVFPALIQ